MLNEKQQAKRHTNSTSTEQSKTKLRVEKQNKQTNKTKNLTKKPNSEIERLVQNEYVVFTVLHTEGTLDLIAPNFAVFSTFQIAMEELIKQKKNIYSYLK